MISKTFVGRRDELKQIQDWVQGNSNGLVLITGAGGIGKTSLIRKIADEYSVNDRFVVEYFDLAEQPMTTINQAVHLADSIGREHFTEFMAKLTELDTASNKITVSGGLENEAIYIFVDEIATYLRSQSKKLLRITDTFEIAMRYSNYEDDWAGGINDKLKNIPDTVFIIAGRDKLGEKDILGKFHPVFENAFGKENILQILLKGFNEGEADDFFAESDKHMMIPQEMRDKLQLLTEGRPILLSLAVEWLQKDIPLPIMIEKSLPELRKVTDSQEERRKLLDQFEFELVSKIRELKNPLDIVSLYMAHIDRRMDSKLLSILLKINDTEAESHLKELLLLPFVKEYIASAPQKCTLHDEMRELVRKHAWEVLDISGTERDQLTHKVIEQYYLPHIDQLKQKKLGLLNTSRATLLQDAQSRAENQERWLLEAETVYYFSKLGEEEAFKFFDQVFYDKEDSYIRDQYLLDELKRAGLNREKIALRDADGLRRRGQIEDARRICLEVINNNDISVDDRIHAYTALGAMEEGDPIAAEKHFLQALDLAEAGNNQRVQAILHNNLGRLYRNMCRLEDSIDHFNKSLTLLRRSGNSDSGVTVRNNLAWTYRLNGDLDEADVLCRLSISENKRRGLERPLAYAYLTKADIDRDKGDIQNAARYVKQALEIFNRLEDDEGTAQAYRTQANISRYLHYFDQALSLLKDGIHLAKETNSLPILASLYQLYGRTIRHYAIFIQDESMKKETSYASMEAALFAEALNNLKKSIELSQRTGNRWEVARSQIEIALITMLMQESYDEAYVNDLLGQVWQTAIALDDPLLKGYVCENRGRVEQRKRDFLSAGNAFGEAALHVARRTGLETSRAFARLHNLLLNQDLKNDQSSLLAQGIIEKIQQQPDYQKYPKLIALTNLCEQILDLRTVRSGN